MRIRRLALLLCALLSGTSYAQTTLTVPESFSSIQMALNAAAEGDTVRLAPGTYFERIEWPEVDGIHLHGSGSAHTIIHGDGSGGVLRMTSPSITRATVVRDLQVRNGGSVEHGGGIMLDGASPTLISVLVTDNHASSCGGGVFTRGGRPVMISLLVARNTAGASGGGLCVEGGEPVLTAVMLTLNHAVKFGGGLAASASRMTMTSVHVVENTVTGEGSAGGGAFIEDAILSLRDVAVEANAADHGGGMYVAGGHVAGTRITVNGNTARGYGGGVYVAGRAALSGAEIFSNTASFGGGLYSAGSEIDIARTTVDSNRADQGGGVYMGAGTAQLSAKLARAAVDRQVSPRIRESSVAENEADEGGGIYISEVDAIVEKTSIAGNAAGQGGGILLADGGASFRQGTVSNHTSQGFYVAAGHLVVEESNFSNNRRAIKNAGQVVVQALSNWWGDSTGPFHPLQNPTGKGNAVDAFVDIMPFMGAPDPEAPPIPVGGLRAVTLGPDTITLEWNPSPMSDLEGYRLCFDTLKRTKPACANPTPVISDTMHTISGLQPSTTYFVYALTVDRDGNSSWRSDGLQVTTAAGTARAKDVYPPPAVLNQNFPNPFVDRTRIVYSIQQPSHVRLSVLDAIGRRVAVLVDEPRPPGVYRLDYTARNLPSGIYFYRLEAEGTSMTRQMAIMR